MTSEKPRYLVIGSGPAALAATKALVDAGHHVTIADAGNLLEPEIETIVDRMAQTTPEHWDAADVENVVGTRKASREAVHSKLSYGSSYAFAPPRSEPDVRWKEKAGGFYHSLAKGGLSNIWGSSLLPYRDEDIRDWPIGTADLAAHYKAVMGFVPSTAVNDGLAEILPHYSAKPHTLKPSRQGCELLGDLESNQRNLQSAGVYFGKSRLAISADGDGNHKPCQYCALCLTGCPYRIIYSSAHTLDELTSSGKVTYLPNHLVDRFHQERDEVIVSGNKGNSPFNLKADRVFVAAGVLPTASIVLKSIGSRGDTVRLVDSQYFIYPILRFRRVLDVETERMHTSSQVFLEIDDDAVSPHLVHLQLYGFSRFLLSELERTFLRIPLRNSFFRKHFLGRLMIVQGFLHSNDSGHIDIQLKTSGENFSTHLEMESSRPFSTLLSVLKVGLKLTAQTFKLRAIPIFPGLKIPSPGSGYHSGGTFPMSKIPGKHETDTLGRFTDYDRVHVVDSSILPSIPATSITMSVMANSHRIASVAASLDSP